MAANDQTQDTAARVVMDTREIFEQKIKSIEASGIAIASDKRQKGKVVFKNGTKLRLTQKGYLICKYANGQKVQYSPNGIRITVCVCNPIKKVHW